jgi:hypothetical protein
MAILDLCLLVYCWLLHTIGDGVYGRLAEVSYCHECSLILAEELEKNQLARSRISPRQTPVPASLPTEPVFAPVPSPPESAFVSQQPSIRIPQPRTIDRDKMTVEQLLEEAKMLDKTWGTAPLGGG